jgi:hypothetical protein
MRLRLRFATLIVALLVAFLAAPVAAATTWQTFSQSGTQAFAVEGPRTIADCTDNPGPTVTCENESIDVFKGTEKATGVPSRKVERACYSQSSDTFNPKTGAGTSEVLFGCTEGARTLTINDLDSIVLAPTPIDLVSFTCTFTQETFECTEPTPGGTITVSGTWTAEGPVFTQRSKFRFDDGTCMQVDASKSRSRDASFDGGISGNPIEANFAAVSQGSFTFRTSCPF